MFTLNIVVKYYVSKLIVILQTLNKKKSCFVEFWFVLTNVSGKTNVE